MKEKVNINHHPTRRVSPHDSGYTLMEIVAVLTRMVILTGVAVIKFSASDTGKVRSAAQVLVSDVSYCQDIAKQSNIGTEMVITSAGGGGGGGGGPCFVATACYGEYSPQVAALRGLRDRILRQCEPGRMFIDWYYANGPRWAEAVKGNPVLQRGAQLLLLPVALVSLPFAGDAFALGGGDDGGGGSAYAPNTYVLQYQDGTIIPHPQGGGLFIISLGDRVSITSSNRTIRFNGSGRMSVVSYSWSNNQTSMVFCTLNGDVNLRIARHSGRAWVE
jgi:type II secretory pathway pseudopilin PulG